MNPRSRFCGLVIGVTVAALACSDSATDPGRDGGTRYPLLSAAIVSDAHAGSSAGTTTVGGPVAVSWISPPPGALEGVTTVRVRDASGNDLTGLIPVVNGGFDPVPVPALAGDELVLVLNQANGGSTFASVRVPPRRPPLIVRTSPPDGRIDVALDVRPAVIFSEPIDQPSLEAAPVLLLVEGQPVAGALEVPESQPWLVRFVPDHSLAPGTTYDLVVAHGVRDLEGDALEADYVARFTTSGAPLPMDLAFVSNRSGEPWIYLTNRTGTAVRRLTRGERPRWSADGSKLVFQRRLGGIFTINADGSNLRGLTEGRFPAWSPDGRILFVDGERGPAGGGLNVMNADGSGAHLLVPHTFADTLPNNYYGVIEHSAWSPDGSRVAFDRVVPYDGPRQIWIVDADGSNPRLLSPDLWDNTQPSWSPDGLRIAARGLAQGTQIGDPSFSDAIVDYDADGSGLFRVHAWPIFPYTPRPYLEYPDWSPDGLEILFDQPVSQGVPGILQVTSVRIFAVTLETGLVRQLIPDVIDPAFANYADYQGAWSPAGR